MVSTPKKKVAQKVRFNDSEQRSESPVKEVTISDEQRRALKRYFNDMIDDYPQYFVAFVQNREKIKRLKKEVDEHESRG